MKKKNMENRNIICFILLMLMGVTPLEGAEKKFDITTSQQPQRHVKKKLEELTVSHIKKGLKSPEQLYTLSFRKADIHEILTVLSRKIKLNIIIDPDVKGNVTVDLKDVTLNNALNSILTPLRLQYKMDDNFIRVSPVKMQTRVFILNYLATKRKGSDAVSGTTGRTGYKEDKKADSGSFIEIKTSDVTDLWNEIEKSLKVISSNEGKLAINKVAGSIVANDYPQNLTMMEEFFNTVEDMIQKQVMVQTRVIEVTLSNEYQMGIDWSAIAESGSFKGTFTQALNPAAEIFQIGISDSDFTFLLDAMSKQGKIDILSSPKVSTLNNQPAVIKVAREDVYWEREDIYGESLSTITYTPRWITIGILLRVTPQIGSDGLITMDIHPSVTDKAGDAVSSEGDTAPILDVRETNTVVKVRDGQTIIIAGLMQKRTKKEVTNVPFFGKIPILGDIFQKTVEEKQKTELVIILTPNIMTGNETEAQSLKGLISEEPRRKQ
ncbi:MAG: secretin and TonB N-terminal domain-containing protein [Thermodesulfobacteriota bacterium]|nr:secretin and TonB N-terminal domain-containing protein [Thermodesulfobacteriota bacterium]